MPGDLVQMNGLSPAQVVAGGSDQEVVEFGGGLVDGRGRGMMTWLRFEREAPRPPSLPGREALPRQYDS